MERLVETGAGPLAVADHGGPGTPVLLWPSVFTDRALYAPLAALWSGARRLVVIEGPGHGRSGPPPKALTMAACGEAIERVADALDLDRVAVGGTSWGGIAGAELALARPGRVAALILMNTPMRIGAGRPGLGSALIPLGARLALGTSLYRRGLARSFFGTARPHEGFDAHLAAADPVPLSRAVRAVLRAREPLMPRLPGIAAPTLLVAGARDTLYPLSESEEAARAIPDARLRVLPTGHLSMAERPEDCAALIEEFLAERGL